jgi:hypothetical protein
MKNNTVANREERIHEKLIKPSPRPVRLPIEALKLNSTSGSNTNKIS